MKDIKQHRLQAGMTQAKLAKLAGITQPTLSRIEDGLAQPSLKTLDRLCRALGLRVELLEKKR